MAGTSDLLAEYVSGEYLESPCQGRGSEPVGVMLATLSWSNFDSPQWRPSILANPNCKKCLVPPIESPLTHARNEAKGEAGASRTTVPETVE